MQDRYLFRGKRIDNGEWEIGYLYCTQNHAYISNDHADMVEVDKETICQCTGLKDKNGKLIWENDILHYKWDGDRIDFVEYRAPIFTYSGSFRWSLHEDEVIGNRFDNPELLEVQE